MNTNIPKIERIRVRKLNKCCHQLNNVLPKNFLQSPPK
ncbi:helix-loop-helix domain-containing protein [Polynucleobacter sp. 86C-FISCH]